VVGYCLGGRLAFLCATRTDSDATVGYYGVGLDNLLGERQNISKPLLLHIATRDKFSPPEAQAKVRAALKGQSAGHDLRVRRRSRLRAWQRQRAGASAGAAGRCTDASVF
jgi:Dienelactone hydrolase and related enzymes